VARLLRRRGPLAGPELVAGALIGEVPLLAALVAPRLVAVHAAADELHGTAVVDGDGGGERAPVEHLAVHLGCRGRGVLAADEEDESDPAAAPGVAVLEDGDARDAAEPGEEEVEVRVGEREVQVGHVHRRLGRREATGTPASAAAPTAGLAAASPGGARRCGGGGERVPVEEAVVIAVRIGASSPAARRLRFGRR